MYPLTTLNFKVQWGDDPHKTINFSEVSGLTMEAEVVEYRGGADPQQSTHKQAGLKKFGNVTMKRGIAPADSGNGLFEWYSMLHTRSDQLRRTVTVTLCNEQREEVMTWAMRDAWPVKLEGPGLKSTGTDVAIESVEFACEGITVEVH